MEVLIVKGLGGSVVELTPAPKLRARAEEVWADLIAHSHWVKAVSGPGGEGGEPGALAAPPVHRGITTKARRISDRDLQVLCLLPTVETARAALTETAMSGVVSWSAPTPTAFSGSAPTPTSFSGSAPTPTSFSRPAPTPISPIDEDRPLPPPPPLAERLVVTAPSVEPPSPPPLSANEAVVRFDLWADGEGAWRHEPSAEVGLESVPAAASAAVLPSIILPMIGAVGRQVQTLVFDGGPLSLSCPISVTVVIEPLEAAAVDKDAGTEAEAVSAPEPAPACEPAPPPVSRRVSGAARPAAAPSTSFMGGVVGLVASVSGAVGSLLGFGGGAKPPPAGGQKKSPPPQGGGGKVRPGGVQGKARR